MTTWKQKAERDAETVLRQDVRIRALEARAEKVEAALTTLARQVLADHRVGTVGYDTTMDMARAAGRESGGTSMRAEPGREPASEAPAAKSAARPLHDAPMPDPFSGGGAARSGHKTGAPFGQAKDPGKAARLPRRGSAEDQERGT